MPNSRRSGSWKKPCATNRVDTREVSILAPGAGLKASASAFLGWRGVARVHFRSAYSPSQIRQLAVFGKPRLAVGFARLFFSRCKTEILLDFLLDLLHRSWLSTWLRITLSYEISERNPPQIKLTLPVPSAWADPAHVERKTGRERRRGPSLTPSNYFLRTDWFTALGKTVQRFSAMIA
jgi:hypothetical protein